MISDLDRFFAELETEEFSLATKPNATMATISTTIAPTAGHLHRAPMESNPESYRARVRAAFSKINHHYPAGMVAWLAEAHRELYEELTSRIPSEIDRLWNEYALLEEFEGTLDRWVAVHREGCRLYRADHAGSALTRAYSPEETAATEDAQNPAFKCSSTTEVCEISERSADMEAPVTMRSDPEKLQ